MDHQDWKPVVLTKRVVGKKPVPKEKVPVTGMNKNLSLKLAPKSKIDGVVKPPGSKSITNRLLLLSSLCNQSISLTNHLIKDILHI